MALSRGGKDRLAAAAGIVLEGEPARGPALPPTADGIGMQVETSGGGRIGERRRFVEEQNQVSALPEVRRCRASVREAPGLGEELIREGRAMKRRRAGHETTPPGMGQMGSRDSIPSIVAALEGP